MTDSTSHEFRSLVRRVVRNELTALRTELHAAVAELRDELHAETTALDRRVTEVHERALRELTRRAGRKPE